MSEHRSGPVGPAGPVGGPAGAGRGRPRNAAADTAIIEAVLRLLEEGTGIDGLSMEGLARRAGVSKATVYRRWSSKDALLFDVLRSIEEQEQPQPAGDSVRDELVAILEGLRRRGLTKRNSALLRTVLGHVRSHPQLWESYRTTVIESRRAQLDAVLRRGVRTGEIRADLDPELLGDLFVGPMVTRAMLHQRQDLPDGLAERIVDGVLEGARPRGRFPAAHD